MQPFIFDPCGRCDGKVVGGELAGRRGRGGVGGGESIGKKRYYRKKRKEKELDGNSVLKMMTQKYSSN